MIFFQCRKADCLLVPGVYFLSYTMNHHIIQAAAAAASAGRLLAEDLMESPAKRAKKGSKATTRGNRRFFAFVDAYNAILRDYMGIPGHPNSPLFGSEFKLMFRLSRPRFQRLMEDIMARNIAHFQKKKNLLPSQQSCLEAKLLLPSTSARLARVTGSSSQA